MRIMVRERDVCWEYCDKMDGNKVRCKFCQKVLNGGISRLKFHLSRIPSKGVHPCAKVRDDVAERVRDVIAMKEEGKEVGGVKRQRFAEVKSSSVIPTTELLVPLESTPRLLKFPSPLARPASPPDLERCIAEFIFEHKLDLCIVRTASFQRMLDAIGGSGFRLPSPETLKTTCLQNLKDEITVMMKETEKDWATTGCTILADSWTDNKSKVLINFSVSSPLGTFFLKSVDASTHAKGLRGLYDLFDSVIQDIGPENVVQVITDNSMSYGNVGNQIMQNYNTIFWSPCAFHCINSILEDFSKIDWVSRCIMQAMSITRFIYNHSWLLDFMKNYTGGQELVRTGITKSISDFLTLQCVMKYRPRLKLMFNSSEYSTSPYVNKPHSITCIDILDDNEFWGSVEEIAAVSEPLLKVLRDVSGGKPAIGTIYESMYKVKDSIRTYYIMDELKCNMFLDIIDRKWRTELHSPLHAAAAYLNPSIQYNPDVKFLSSIKEEFIAVLDKMLLTPELRHDITSQLYIFRKAQGMFGSNLAREARNTTTPGMWWEQYGDSAPGLQRAAVRILSQVCSTSMSERNWSLVQQIHSERHNRLDKDALTDLLYVQHNLKLRSKGNIAESDPIALTDIDMSSEWVEDTENPNPTLWLDRFPSALDGSDLNTRQFGGLIFGSNDQIFGL